MKIKTYYSVTRNKGISISGLTLLLSAGSAGAALLDASTLTQMTNPINNPGLPDFIFSLPTTPAVPPSDPAIGNFAGTWEGTAAPAGWKGGNWEADGLDTRRAASPVVLGIPPTIYDFTPINGLPSSTYFTIGDIDFGSGDAEVMSMSAFSNGALITTPWLDLIGTTATSDFELPSYSWDAVTGTYFFDGRTVLGNPNVVFTMASLVEIDTLTVSKVEDLFGYSLAAPVSASVVPVPASVWLFFTGLLGLIGVAKRK